MLCSVQNVFCSMLDVAGEDSIFFILSIHHKSSIYVYNAKSNAPSMDALWSGHRALSSFPPLGRFMVGTSRSAFHL